MIILFPFLLVVVSCEHEGVPADQMEHICFKEQVLPILTSNCIECHNDSRSEGGYSFADSTGANFSKGFVAYNSSKSKIYKAITSQIQLMPPHNPLPMYNRIIIRLWIEQGANYDLCDTLVHNHETVNLLAPLDCYEQNIQPTFSNIFTITDFNIFDINEGAVNLSRDAKSYAYVNPENTGFSLIRKIELRNSHGYN